MVAALNVDPAVTLAGAEMLIACSVLATTVSVAVPGVALCTDAWLTSNTLNAADPDGGAV